MRERALSCVRDSLGMRDYSAGRRRRRDTKLVPGYDVWRWDPHD